MSDKVFRAVQIVLFVIVIVVFLFSLYKVVNITMEYKASRDEYKELENFVQIEDEPEIPVVAEPTEPVKESNNTTSATTESKEE